MIAQSQTPSTSTRHFVPPTVMTPEAFHAAIGAALGKNRIYELLHAGKLRHVRNGNRYLILASEIHDFFEREAGPLGAS